METKFNFKSAICTSREQSERLLVLGLKPETADCYYWQECDQYGDPNGKWHLDILNDDTREHFEYLLNHFGICLHIEDALFIPAWGLHRLIEMMPENVTTDDWLGVSFDDVSYYHGNGEGMIGWKYYKAGNLYDCIIECYEWLIKKGYFNKEYLV